eukprot:2001422-Ditylum_brightwellii.AAC.1
MRNVESTVHFSLNCAKDKASSGGGLVSYIKESMEGASILDTIMRLNYDNTDRAYLQCMRSQLMLAVARSLQ